MKKAQLPLIAELSLGADTQDSTAKNQERKFSGTANLRHLRVIHAAMTRALPREQLDQVAGCSNGPELVAELRRRGLDFPCERTPAIDRDGFIVKPGVYHLTEQDRRKIIKFQSAKLKQTRNPHILYELRKKQWDAQNPDASAEQRDATMNQIAKECGV